MERNRVPTNRNKKGRTLRETTLQTNQTTPNKRPPMLRNWKTLITGSPKEPSRYKPEYDQLAYEHMATGKSETVLAIELGVTMDELIAWKRKHPSFGESLKKGIAASQAWWEELARNNIISPTPGRFNVALWIFNMKNRFGWTDRQDINQTNTNESILKIDLSTLSDEQLSQMEGMEGKDLKKTLQVLNGGKG